MLSMLRRQCSNVGDVLTALDDSGQWMSETVLKVLCGNCREEQTSPDMKAFAAALQALMNGEEYTKERDTSIQCLGAVIRILIECYMKVPQGDKAHALLRYEMEFLFKALANPEDEVVKNLDMFTRLSLNGVRKMLEKAREP